MQHAEKNKFPFVLLLIAALIFGGFILFVLRVSSFFPEKEIAQDISMQDVAQADMCDDGTAVTVEQVNDTDYAVVLRDRTLGVIQTQNFSTVELFQDSGCFVYLAVMPSGMGGYINYSIEPLELYRVSRLDQSLMEISTNNTNITDVSPDETMIVGTKTYEGPAGSFVAVVVTNIVTGSFEEYPALGAWGAGGDAFFSPDGTKIAFSVAKNNPDSEASQIMTLDIATGLVVPFGDVMPDVILHVQGWKDAQTPDVL